MKFVWDRHLRRGALNSFQFSMISGGEGIRGQISYSGAKAPRVSERVRGAEAPLFHAIQNPRPFRLRSGQIPTLRKSRKVVDPLLPYKSQNPTCRKERDPIQKLKPTLSQRTRQGWGTLRICCQYVPSFT